MRDARSPVAVSCRASDGEVGVAASGLHRASMDAAREALRKEGGSQNCSNEQKRHIVEVTVRGLFNRIVQPRVNQVS